MDLVEEVLSREEWLPSEQFGQYAPYGPDVHCLGVFTGVENDLRGTIPPCYHIFSFLLLFLDVTAREAEIANLQVTALVLDCEVGTSSKLLGFRSRCRTLAECMKSSPRKIW